MRRCKKLKYRSPGDHSEHALPKTTNSEHNIRSMCTQYALSQRGLNSNIFKIGTANHVNSSTLPSPKILCCHTHHISDLSTGIISQHSPCLCARHDKVHPKRIIRNLAYSNKVHASNIQCEFQNNTASAPKTRILIPNAVARSGIEPQ